MNLIKFLTRNINTKKHNVNKKKNNKMDFLVAGTDENLELVIIWDVLKIQREKSRYSFDMLRNHDTSP